MVGNQITKLNPMRAYCVALSAAITVIIASWLGLPVSSTHIAVGAVFGVGFFREWYTEKSTRRADYVARHKLNKDGEEAGKRPACRAAPPQAGPPLPFPADHRRLGDYGAGGRRAVGRAVCCAGCAGLRPARDAGTHPRMTCRVQRAQRPKSEQQ
jgi:hypothetical protein